MSGRAPPDLAQAIDFAAGSADDRAWFERHHGRNHRLRKPIGGEYLLVRPSRGFKPMVVVKQLEPGSRVRAPFGWRRGEPSDQRRSVAERLFWLNVADRDVTLVDRSG